MKALLLTTLVALCLIGWFSPAMVNYLSGQERMQVVETGSAQSLAASQEAGTEGAPQGMSLAEYEALAKKDPEAYQKLLKSREQQAPRSEIDKLMNFFAHLKYE